MTWESYRVRPGPVQLQDWPTSDGSALSRPEAEARSAEVLGLLSDLQERLYAEGQQSLLIILQARDAGGKDGTVKHVFSGLNPQGIRVVSFKVPTLQERAHDFLWRIHAQVPAAGEIVVFNRSHYEDVLVPRVHAHTDLATIQERLEFIRAFEQLLHSRGTRILKFYLHISPEEQLKRLKKRLENPQKHWKFDPGDLIERARWNDYTLAYEAAISITSTESAPWYIIPADQKWFRNLTISECILHRLQEMNPRFPTPSFDPLTVAIE
ncbi:polyphosphate kinase 2 family protein [Deinococcus peraridilitoris]|uniref:Polyphosphate:nucleotide phosphotransferase, PPK2 family n=1 Tax=Deinococcus peraridilitoris (strain DSM 19664 / LMG 22246 / CIP 109416 / KR-200) TaxID=937777 RepID=L0A3E7_DEIPD|nr:polyphosphate kinase 2 family protein [Deinococcus peraridilitoris]AFZ67964.1 polyphosphate:nucleotide phosphotransferase, PPK2 family [Deinococcus peraridilitoris DSM 19664]